MFCYVYGEFIDMSLQRLDRIRVPKWLILCQEIYRRTIVLNVACIDSGCLCLSVSLSLSARLPVFLVAAYLSVSVSLYLYLSVVRHLRLLSININQYQSISININQCVYKYPRRQHI